MESVMSFSYEQLFQTMRELKLPYPDAEQMFRRMVFNVAARNCDNHTKNFSFQLKKDAKWELAPAYDVCHAWQPNHQWVNNFSLCQCHTGKSLARVGKGGTGCRPHLRCQYDHERTSKTPGGACSKTSLNSSFPTMPCSTFKSSGVPKVMTCARKCTGSASSSSGVLNHTTRRATFKMSGVMGKGFMMLFRFRLSAWRKVLIRE